MAHEDNQEQTDFREIKHTASSQVGSVLKELQEFELAIQTENMPVIYRIYKGRLHNEINATANGNHEIDELLMKNLHDRFIEAFPFMKMVSRPAATLQHYQIETYYHERATIALDAAQPSIFILPGVEDEWLTHQKDQATVFQEIEKKMDQLDARSITLTQEASELEAEQLDMKEKIQLKKEESKGFFGRDKQTEELERMEAYLKTIETKLTEVQTLIEDQTALTKEKEQLMRTYETLRLNQAITTKEFRLIHKHFGSFEAMIQKLEAFLADYLKEEV